MLNFDGVNEWVDLRAGGAVLTLLDGAAGGTIMGWFNFDAVISGNFHAVSINNGGVPTIASRLSMQGSAAGVLECFAQADDADAFEQQDDAGGAIPTGTLIHLAVAVNVAGDTISFYRDGVLTQTDAVTFAGATFTASGSAAASIMAQDDGSANWGDGRASDLRVYSRLLSSAEIQTIHAMRGHDGIVSGLVSRYPMVYQPPLTVFQASPQVQSVTTTTRAANSTSQVVSMPATVNVGDLLLVLMCVRNAAAFTGPGGGWTELWDVTNGTAGAAGYAKVADGTEGGTTVTFTTTGSDSLAAQTYRISDWFGALTGIEHAGATGADAAPNPPNLVPSWGNTLQSTLWLAVSGAGDDDTTHTAAPATFTNLTSTVSGAGANSGAEVGSARLTSAVASLNPGTFTLAAVQDWVARTVAIRPAQSVKDVSNSGRHGTVGGTPDMVEGVLSIRKRYH